MAIVQVSKIIQKNGNQADLPQLDIAEIGYSTDEKRVFIGDEFPASPDPAQLYNTEILTQNSVDGTTIIYDPTTGLISAVGGGGGGAGTVSSVNVSGGATGLTTSGGPIITFGTITLAGTLNISHGGTGANNATRAFINLAPSIANNSGKFLTTDGANVSWATASAFPAGSNTQIQYNENGAFGASNNLTYDSANDVLVVGALNLTSVIESGTGQAMTLMADQVLTLHSNTSSIRISLPSGSSNKASIVGPTSVDYATGLSLNDLVNKQYVDSALSNANFLPSQTGNSGKYLTTNGTSASWAVVPGGGGGGSGTVTSVNVSGGTTGLTTTGGPINTVGTITIAGTLNLSNGGTGANTATRAFINLAPSIANNAGKYLTTDGVNVSWATVATPAQGAAGADTQVQFNSTGALGASNNFTYDSSFDVLTVGTVSSSEILTLRSLNNSISMTLPTGSSKKISIVGPTASDYATGLSLNDLVNKQYVDSFSYVLPKAGVGSGGTLGGVKVDGTTVNIDANGVISSNTVLPKAGVGSGGTLGGVKVDGSTINIDSNGVISSTGLNIRNSITGTVFVPNNTISAPVVHNLGYIPIISLWINSANTSTVTTTTAVEVTTTQFLISAGGSGGWVNYAYW